MLFDCASDRSFFKAVILGLEMHVPGGFYYPLDFVYVDTKILFSFWNKNKSVKKKLLQCSRSWSVKQLLANDCIVELSRLEIYFTRIYCCGIRFLLSNLYPSYLSSVIVVPGNATGKASGC